MNRSMRITLNQDPRCHVQPMLDELKLLSVNQRLHHNSCVLMWKAVHGRAPAHLVGTFPLMADQERLTATTRSMSKLNVQVRGIPHQRSFRHRGADAWNSLPHNIQEAPTLSSFKKQLRDHILHNVPSILE